MKNLGLTLLLIIFTFTLQQINAVPAYPYPVKIKQIDGTTISVVMKGDEFHRYFQTEDGYLITKGKNGIYNYAVLDINDAIQDTKVKANDLVNRSNSEKAFISNLDTNISMQKINTQMRTLRNSVSASDQPSKVYPRTGSPKALVILVNFSDLSFVTPTPSEAFHNMLNLPGYSENGATGSARDYFDHNSMGIFTPDFEVVGPYTLPNTMAFYGENDGENGDKNPIQMVVDACTAAFNDGIDFSQYDVDNDKILDNVFIYYAGHNEAEWAGENTVWPHRWAIYPTSMYNGGNYSGPVSTITFNGVRVFDYACTSELRGQSGTNMAGIGTFTHEFGHVLGLADMYATNGAKHMTLSQWNIMDGGSYLNQGRTPPAYNSFERFQLGYLTPTILKDPISIELNPLTTSNTAYLIAQNDVHNLNPSNPSPSEFFLLENRQRIGWDRFLPGHGMLIYRINFNHTDWNMNRPNNDPLKMGVDIMEADGVATTVSLGGDPFPGTANVTSYTPTLRSGTVLDKPITTIEENENVISFRYRGGGDVPIISTESLLKMFETVQGTPSEPQIVKVSGIRIVEDIQLSFTLPEHFEMKKESDPETAWAKTLNLAPEDSIVNSTNILIRYNPTEPSFRFLHSSVLVLTSKHADKRLINVVGKSTRPVYVVEPVATEATDVTYKGFVANWNPVFDATGYYLTVSQADENGSMSPLFEDKWTTQTSEQLYYLISDKEYEYKVKASDKNLEHEYENITGYSNTIKVRTLPYQSEKELRVVVNSGVAKVFVPSVGTTVNVFNALGQKIRSIQSNSEILDLSGLPKNVVLIIQADKYRSKVIIK